MSKVQKFPVKVSTSAPPRPAQLSKPYAPPRPHAAQPSRPPESAPRASVAPRAAGVAQPKSAAAPESRRTAESPHVGRPQPASLPAQPKPARPAQTPKPPERSSQTPRLPPPHAARSLVPRAAQMKAAADVSQAASKGRRSATPRPTAAAPAVVQAKGAAAHSRPPQLSPPAGVIQLRKGAGKMVRRYQLPAAVEKHVFDGEIHTDGNSLTGFHSLAVKNPGNGKAELEDESVIHQTRPFQARVRVKIDNTWYPKGGGYKASTMFPAGWSKAKVIQAIEFAMTDPDKAKQAVYVGDEARAITGATNARGKRIGKAFGVTIVGTTSGGGVLETVYPSIGSNDR